MPLSERDALVVEALKDQAFLWKFHGYLAEATLLQSFITDLEAKAPAVDLRKWTRHDDGCDFLKCRVMVGDNNKCLQPVWAIDHDGESFERRHAFVARACTCGLDAALGHAATHKE